MDITNLPDMYAQSLRAYKSWVLILQEICITSGILKISPNLLIAALPIYITMHRCCGYRILILSLSWCLFIQCIVFVLIMSLELFSKNLYYNFYSNSHGALMFLQRLADRLSSTWGNSYGHVLMWIKVRLAFAVVQATNLCFHGSRVHWWSGPGIDDGASLPCVSLA